MLGCSDSSKPARYRSATMQCYPLVRAYRSKRAPSCHNRTVNAGKGTHSLSKRTALRVLMTAISAMMTAMSVRMTAISVRMTGISVLMTTMKLLMGRSASVPGLQAADVVSVGVTLLELWVDCLWHGAKTEPGCAKERVVALQKARRPQQRNARRAGVAAPCAVHGASRTALCTTWQRIG